MESNFIKTGILVFVNMLDSGGTKPIILLLMMVIAGLAFQIKRLNAQIDRKDDKIDKILDDYHKGNMTLAEALNQLKIVLFEIRVRL